jgi:hypothetical protein
MRCICYKRFIVLIGDVVFVVVKIGVVVSFGLFS